MAKSNYSAVQLKACELADQIRWTLAIHPVRQGWICRPHHTNRQIKVGHQDYGLDPYITAECDTLYASLQQLGLGEDIGYAITLSNS